MTSEELLTVLRGARPSWETDGRGIRGGPEGGPFAPETARPARRPFSVGPESEIENVVSSAPDFPEPLFGGGGALPSGCPFDLGVVIEAPEPTASAPSPASTKSYFEVMRHTGCVDGVGNNTYDRYSALMAEPDKVGLKGYHGEDLAGYFELATKGQAETFLWGYADQGASNFRGRAFGAESDFVVYTGDNANYGEMKCSPGKVTVYGFSDNEVYNFLLGADDVADSSYLRVFGAGSNVYATLATEPDKSFLWGYSQNESFNYGLTAGVTEALFEIWHESSGNYSASYARPTETGFYSQNNESFLGGVVKVGESSLWGYSAAGGGPTGGGFQYKIISVPGEAKLQVFNDAGWAEISGTSTNFQFQASKNNDFSYLTQNTLRIQYANGDSLTGNPGNFYVNYASGAYSRLYGGGLYINNGSNWVQISPPGQDAYFQSVSICVDGTMKTAMVLMTAPV